MQRNLPTTSGHYQERGLNGFFSWLRKAVNKVAQVVTKFSPMIGGWLNDFSDGNGEFFGIAFGNYWERSAVVDQIDLDIEVTPLDEANLDNWLSNNFLPYFNSILQQLEDFKKFPPSTSEFIVYYNDVNILMGYLLKQSQLDRINGVPGLSTNGVIARTEFLTIQIKTFQASLDEYVHTQDLDLFTRKASLTISTSKYNSLGFNSPSEVLISYKEVAVLDGVDIDYEEIKDPSTGPTTGNPNTISANQSKGNNGIGKVIFWSALGYFTNKLVSKNQ